MFSLFNFAPGQIIPQSGEAGNHDNANHYATKDTKVNLLIFGSLSAVGDLVVNS